MKAWMMLTVMFLLATGCGENTTASSPSSENSATEQTSTQSGSPEVPTSEETTEATSRGGESYESSAYAEEAQEYLTEKQEAFEQARRALGDVRTLAKGGTVEELDSEGAAEDAQESLDNLSKESTFLLEWVGGEVPREYVSCHGHLTLMDMHSENAAQGLANYPEVVFEDPEAGEIVYAQGISSLQSAEEEAEEAEACLPKTGHASSEESPATEGVPDSEISPDRAIVREAVENYYLALGAGDWYSTYETLDPIAQSEISLDEWEAGNEEMASEGLPIYHIESIENISEDGDSYNLAGVSLSVTHPDGNVTREPAVFVLFEGRWLRFLTPEETVAFDDVPVEEESAEPETPESTESTPDILSDPNWTDRLEPF